MRLTITWIVSSVLVLACVVLQLDAQRGGAAVPAVPGAPQRLKVGEEHEAALRVRRLRAFLRNNVLQGTQHSSRAATRCTEFIAARATAPICAVASREAPTFCAPK